MMCIASLVHPFTLEQDPVSPLLGGHSYGLGAGNVFGPAIGGGSDLGGDTPADSPSLMMMADNRGGNQSPGDWEPLYTDDLLLEEGGGNNGGGGNSSQGVGGSMDEPQLEGGGRMGGDGGYAGGAGGGGGGLPFLPFSLPYSGVAPPAAHLFPAFFQQGSGNQ